MSRELDARVAEAMGCAVEWREYNGRREAFCTCPDRTHEQANTTAPRMLARYSEDIAAARTMEDWIEEHGLQVRYAGEMLTLLRTGDAEPERDEGFWWALLHATPEQRCRAFLAAIGK